MTLRPGIVVESRYCHTGQSRLIGKQSLVIMDLLERKRDNAEWNMRRDARLLAGFVLFTALVSGAVTKSIRFRITVLDAQSKTLSTDPDTTPKDCDQVNYSGYCHESKVAPVRKTMRVQEGDGKPFDITCVRDNHWSKCVALPIGRTFDARKDKHGITIFYEDEKGGASKELYTVVEAAQGTKPATLAATQSSPAMSTKAVSPAQVAAPAAEVNREKIKCNFSSTPPGAEITLDGRYVGNTPSTVGVSTGTHVVVLFMPGFAQWKRELTVSNESVLNVTATLQKSPQ
jgi:hypothetical protein